MAKPKKTQAAEAAVELLRGVSVTAGYHTNLGRNRGGGVGRRMLPLNGLKDTEFPAAVVLMGEARPAEDGCLGAFRETSSLVVVMYGRAADIPAELERLEADAKKAICGASSLGSITGPPRHVSTIPYYQEQANLDRGMVEVTFAVDHNWTAAAP